MDYMSEKYTNNTTEEKNTSGAFRAVVAGLWIVFLTAIDQVTKRLAATKLINGPYVLIQGVFELRYLENRGAAFGILQNARWFFLILTAAFLVLAVWFYVKIPQSRRMLPLRIITIFLMSGAVGNMIDRAILSYVRDFFYFSLIDFPIFNVADMYVTVSAFFLFIYVIFIYKDEDFAFLKKGGKSDV